MSRRRRRTYAAGEAARHRHSWLELLQTSGPSLTLPVVDRVWPTGIPSVAQTSRRVVRAAAAQALTDGGSSRRIAIQTVLVEGLDWGTRLRWEDQVPSSMAEPVGEHGVLLAPDFGFYADPLPAETFEGETISLQSDEEELTPEPAAGPWRLLGSITPWGTHPLQRTNSDGWSASPVERLAVVLRARDVPIGLVTDGRWWAVVWAPIGGTVGASVWDSSVWGEEPESFAAFVALLQRSRFLAVADDDTLPELFAESLEAQEQVTETLGLQVRDAVELLLETLDRLDSESGVLQGVDDDDLYDGVVTVMMRVVFLLFAEERRLLPSDDDIYVAAYSASRLVEQLEAVESLSGAQTLEHRTGAWHRLLATSRALHAGVAHEDLKLPAYGGALFDPSRFPWLEGRTGIEGAESLPPAVDDATVLRLLRAVQYVEVGGERRRLTFRALDVEQIGYVYEGLLELEVRTAPEPILQLIRSKDWPKGKEPSELRLSELQKWLLQTPPKLAAELKARTGRSESRLENDLASALAQHELDALRRHVGGDLADKVLPVAPVLRWDSLGRPAVITKGRRFIAPSTRRASTGAHYTPRVLAEEVADNALEPLVYRPGPLETADRNSWKIRPSTEILDLRVADIAMGSGAFLVAACRYLADRLIDAWQEEGRPDAVLTARHSRQGRSADAEVEQLSLDARRRVADRCLYGVDINPLAVEMAKLSLWLVTMDRERPFGFLDDRFVTGDSLLGVTNLAQLEHLHLAPTAAATFDTVLREDELRQAADLRRRIVAHTVTTGRDVTTKLGLLAKARRSTSQIEAVADALVGVGLRAGELRSASKIDVAFATLAMRVETTAPNWVDGLREQTAAIQIGRPDGVEPRDPLHWPIAFPEVFADTRSPGFDAIIGNPPFLGGQRVTGALGTNYAAALQRWDGNSVKGSADLAARFVLRAERLLNDQGQLGYITTNTLVQGDTLQVGLAQIAERGMTIRRATPSHPWPSSSANLEIVDVWASRAPVAEHGLRILAGEQVPAIGTDLEPVGRIAGRPQRLPENDDLAFQGSNVLGLGFTMPEEQARNLIARDPRNADVLAPYIIGQDLNQRPDSSASRWIINFKDWHLERAETYPEVIEIVRRLVKPERDKNNRSQRRDKWWIYAERAPQLYRTIADLDQVLALSLVSNVVMPLLVETGPVFAHKCAVFALDDFASLAALSSTAHTTWVVRYSSTLETRVNYSPSDVFLTWPRPNSTPDLFRLGNRLDAERRTLMLDRAWGLTTTYNHVHDPSDRDPAVIQLREIHSAIDRAVVAAYGWDLDLEIGHHPTKIGVRWTVSPRARFELLDLLLEENHRRAGLVAMAQTHA
ncbi:DNA methyltransferase [Rhodococcus sp. JG-3]|uniref:Eco57I restriction-modification methylase domain-containing protein n=1 Tax=Rhodococcus sp. JG-3 TaxID=1305835 RepID=UPI0003FC2A5D|nr:DNA methyltransferase [Rhodococcus sp. JG-3]